MLQEPSQFPKNRLQLKGLNPHPKKTKKLGILFSSPLTQPPVPQPKKTLGPWGFFWFVPLLQLMRAAWTSPWLQPQLLRHAGAAGGARHLGFVARSAERGAPRRSRRTRDPKHVLRPSAWNLVLRRRWVLLLLLLMLVISWRCCLILFLFWLFAMLGGYRWYCCWWWGWGW